MSLTPELRQRDFFVTRTLGMGHSNPHDVLRTRKALNVTGQALNVTGQAQSPPNPSKLFDPSLIRSLDRFQRDWGLKEDSVINPSGPTENTLELAVAATRAGGRNGAELLRGPVSVLNRHGLRFDRNPDDTLGPVLWRDRDGNSIPLDRVRGFLSQADTSKETETARRGIRVAAAATGSGATTSDAVPPQSAANPGFRALTERLFGRGVIPEDASTVATGANDQAAPLDDTDAGNDTLGGTGSTGPIASETASPPVQLAQRGGANPWVVKDAKGAGPSNPDFDPWPTSPISPQFRFALHKDEPKDRNYQSIGKKGALGRYQMTQIGLQEAKMKDAKGRWTGKYGIRSAQDFLNDPLA